MQDPAKYQIRARSTEDELKLLKYNDEHLGGKGFVNWQPFDHPQLGQIEIGGWTHMYTFRNPPPRSYAVTEKAQSFIFETIHNNCLFTLRHAACSPLLQIGRLEAQALGADLYKVTAIVKNEGYLPTHLTQMALDHHFAGSVTVTLAGEAEVIMGEPAQDLGHLAGRDERKAPWSPWMRQWSQTAKKAEWLVRARGITTGHDQAAAQRAGTRRRRS